MMLRALLAVSALMISLAVPVAAPAQERVTLGWGRLFNNDTIGDFRDRWQTGSYTVSRLRGESWDGTLPSAPGEILELRLAARVIAPEDLVKPAPWDRRYAGTLALGMHTHFDMRGWETSLGADLVLTGPQTGMGRFQSGVHKAIGLEKPTVLGNQIRNGVHPTLLAETGRSFHIGGGTTVRPFVEAQVGVEDFIRVGGDVMLGGFGEGSLLLRDPVTGQRYQGIAGAPRRGLSYSLGGDIARTFDSAYLPEGGAAQLTDTRTRLRAGVNWQGEKSQVFYGVTYLGKEFKAQPEGQFVGSLNLRLRF